MSPYLEGKLLVAMPGMGDPRFERAVLFLCSHDNEGAMGLVINRPFSGIRFAELLEQLDIEIAGTPQDVPIQEGGPVETGRGFVLHTCDGKQETSLIIDHRFALTATVDILRDIATGMGPRKHLLALGYAGWSPGQLEKEIQENAWLVVDATEKLVFDTALKERWNAAIETLGIDYRMLSGTAGNA